MGQEGVGCCCECIPGLPSAPSTISPCILPHIQLPRMCRGPPLSATGPPSWLRMLAAVSAVLAAWRGRSTCSYKAKDTCVCCQSNEAGPSTPAAEGAVSAVSKRSSVTTDNSAEDKCRNVPFCIYHFSCGHMVYTLDGTVVPGFCDLRQQMGAPNTGFCCGDLLV